MTDNNGRGSDGRFLKNNPGKPKGASKNLLRDKIRTFVDDNFEKLPEWFEGLKPKEKVEAFIALLPYTVSRLQSVNLTDQEGNDLPKATIDYSRLPEDVLRQVLNATTINENQNERQENI